MNDFISIDLVATITSEPVRKGKDVSFYVVNRRGKNESRFKVIIKDDERPIDFNEGDKIFIVKGGFWQAKTENRIAVTANSIIVPIRKRCNKGEKEV